MLNDIRQAIRMLWKQPGFSAVAAATLALGIGANTAIFSVLNGVLIEPLPFPNVDRLILLSVTRPAQGERALPFSYPSFADVRTRTRSIDDAAAWSLGQFNVTSGEPEVVQYAVVTSDFFSVLQTQPALGRGFRPADDLPGAPAAVIISHRLWQQRFGGDPQAPSRSLRLNGRAFEVVGVMPAAFRFLTFRTDTDIWIPLGSDPFVDRRYARAVRSMGVIGRLAPGATMASAQSEMDAIAAVLARDQAEDRGLGIEVLGLREQVVGTLERALAVLTAAVGLVLLIACSNVANLLLARGAARRREMAIRAALGARRSRLAQQLLVEHLMLALVGGSAGLLLGSWALDLLALVPRDAPSLFVPYTLGPERIAVDARVVAFTVLLSLGVAVLFGLGPALAGARTDLVSALSTGHGSLGAGRRESRTRAALVVVEVALCTTLLVGAGLLIRTLSNLERVDPGFDPADALAFDVNLPAPRYADPRQPRRFVGDAVDQLARLPGVRAAGAVEFLPLTGFDSTSGLFIEGRPPARAGEELRIHYRSATPAYFRAMGIRLVSGRGFSETDTESAPRVALINETMAQLLWPDTHPVGARAALTLESLRFRRDGPPQIDTALGMREIVGVIADVRHSGLAQAAVPEMYVPFSQRPVRSMTVVVRTTSGHDPGDFIDAARKIVHAIDPEQPIANQGLVSDLVSASVARPRFNALLLTSFTVLAVVLSVVGLYSVIACSVADRTAEIGIRVALGGTARDVATLVIGQGVKLVALGLALGVAGARVLGRSMEGLLFGVNASDPAIFGAAAAILTIAALGACALPARRALAIDPIAALRSE
jgi:putative ABC transport system permease protein